MNTYLYSLDFRTIYDVYMYIYINSITIDNYDV